MNSVNKQIFSLLGSIGASPYMVGAQRLNSQYAKIETLYEQNAYGDCVAACSALFEQLLGGLYLGVTGETAPPTVILSDIAFWDMIGNKSFCDTAGMLQYACYRVTEGEDAPEGEKAAKLAKTGLDEVIGYTADFLARHGDDRCVDPAVLERDDLREPIHRMAESLRTQMEAAGCSDGFSMQPPFMNAGLLDFPEHRTLIWAQYIARQLKRAGLLSLAEVRTLDAEQVVIERVGMTNEYIRRAAAKANGGVLLVEHFEEFDMPCAGGNLMDRALKTICTAAEQYRGSLCIVVAGEGENVEKAFVRAERGEEFFPLLLSFKR